MSPVFVLSAGRTGTVFLTRTLPAHVPGLHCIHEPPGSRTTLMLGNIAQYTGLGTASLDARLARGIADRFAATPAGSRYVEINPMLCSVAERLPDLVEPLHVVHMVRHPVGWVQSIRAFRASGFRRYLIDHLPFGNPAPVPRPPGWHSYDAVHQALWRWRACNEAIEALQPRSERYTRIRYEDLFRADLPAREATLRTLLDALEAPTATDLEPLLTAPAANRAPSQPKANVPPAAVARICGEMLSRYGYDASEPSTR